MAQNIPVHPWIATLRQKLEGLEAALLKGDALAVETASALVQTVLQQAPKTAEFGRPGSALRIDMMHAAQHFGQLRQAVLRSGAQNQRAIKSLLPQQAQPTYGRTTGTSGALGGAGRAYLSA
jgi:hypothetical protein